MPQHTSCASCAHTPSATSAGVEEAQANDEHRLAHDKDNVRHQLLDDKQHELEDNRASPSGSRAIARIA